MKKRMGRPPRWKPSSDFEGRRRAQFCVRFLGGKVARSSDLKPTTSHPAREDASPRLRRGHAMELTDIPEAGYSKF